jgi:glycosyltransferase involved in cell wall biosynthesis
LVTLPAVRTKGLETLTHSFLSHAILRARPDVVLVFGVGNAIFCRLLRLAGIPTAINVDGADWARRKWGPVGSRYLRWSESVAIRASNAVIADSRSVAAYYEQRYRAGSTYIPYGADIPQTVGTAALERFGLRPREYLLAVGRLVPENGFHHLIAAYARVAPSMPFVIVGDASYGDAYKRQLKEIAPPGVIFTGFQFGDAYHELSAGAYAFLFAAEVGGTHPVLVEQLAHGNCVIARWTESNAEVAGEGALFYKDDVELAERLRSICSDRALVEQLRNRARERAAAYSWDRVTDQYETLLTSLTSRR